MAIEQQQNIENKEQQIKQELFQWVQNLAMQEKDPVKKDLIPKMWEKIINEFQAETGYPLKNMQKTITSTWRTVLEETIFQMPTRQIKTLLPMFDKSNPKRPKLFWFLKTELNKANSKAELEKVWLKQVENLEKQQSILGKEYPEMIKDFSYLDKITDPKQKQQQLKNEMQQLGIKLSDDWLKNLKQNWISVSRFFSLVYTYQRLQNHPTETESIKSSPNEQVRQAYQNFTDNFDSFAQSMQLDLPEHENTEKELSPEVPAQDLQNLTTAQSAQLIEQTDGMQDQIWAVEKNINRDDPNLALERSDKLEIWIYRKAFDNLDDNTPLLAIAQNKPLNQVKQAKTLVQLVKQEYKGNDFNADVQEFVKNINSEVPQSSEKTPSEGGGGKISKLLTKIKLAPTNLFNALKTLNHSEKSLKHWKIKIAKLASNTARTTAVAEFMKTVAGNLTTRVGDTNLWAEVKVDTQNMELDKNGTRSTNIEYGGAKLKMQVDKDWQVQMTDLFNNDVWLQKKLNWLDLKLAWFLTKKNTKQTFKVQKKW